MKRITLVALLVTGLALPALAATFTVGFDSARREWHGPVPAVVEVARAQVPADMVGLTCQATFTAVNNESTHDTDLIVDTNGDTQVVADVESGAATVRDVGPLTLGAEVVLSLRMNEHNARGFAVSSLGGSVTFDCEEPTSTTTTTTPPSTSTSSTSPTETTTTLPNDTTTTLPVQSSTTTIPESTSTTNPAPTTTAPTPSSTVYPDPTDPPPVSETLPETGIETGHLAAIAVIALLAGGGLVAMTPKED